VPGDTAELNVVTGAFSFTGRYIAQRLLDRGKQVLTLTSHPARPNPFGDRVTVAPYQFDNPAGLARSLEGATTLYNTYWIRFPHGHLTYDQAVRNSITLIRAAESAGVRRIVHVSITNAAEDASLPYFRGKGRVEAVIRGSHLSYAILRPTVIFGPEDVLLNNVAWFLRRFPLFAIFGSSNCALQPVFVEDVADLAVAAGEGGDNTILDAVGPEIYTFRGLVHTVAHAVGSHARIVQLPPRLAYALVVLAGYLVQDVVLTWDEVRGLMAGLLVSDRPPTGKTHLSDWLQRHAATVGVRYASELHRHYRPSSLRK